MFGRARASGPEQNTVVDTDLSLRNETTQHDLKVFPTFGVLPFVALLGIVVLDFLRGGSRFGFDYAVGAQVTTVSGIFERTHYGATAILDSDDFTALVSLFWLDIAHESVLVDTCGVGVAISVCSVILLGNGVGRHLWVIDRR